MASLIAGYAPQPMFDRRAIPAYVLIGVSVGTGLALIIALGFRVSSAFLSGMALQPWFLVVAGIACRRLGRDRLAGSLEASGLLYGQGLASFLLLAPLAALSAPLADASLSHFDRLIGFDWASYARLTAPLAYPFSFAYRAFLWEPALIAAVLFLTGRADRGWRFVTASIIALLITMALFPLAPAEGSILYYRIDVWGRAEHFAPALQSLKSGYRVIDPSTVKGIVSFPSYHAAMGAVMAWAWWPTKGRYPFLVLNLLLCAAAVTIGAHYLIDVFAGIAVAAVSISISKVTNG